ncbi:Uncharacterized membrane protein [Pseudomonas aeruginosa]|nr:Uncharacterized membrane protein [Pseudomonas aeruginosa]
MKDVLRIAGAFVGVIVGAGFASGQELLMFFVNFGTWGLAGAMLAAALFTVLGMLLANMGARLRASSHKDVVEAICGRRLGRAVDLMVTFFMFAVTVVMLAGGAALLEQQFGIPALYGGMLVSGLVALVVCLDVQRVITLIGAVTPLLLLMAVLVSLYGLSSRELSFAELDRVAAQQRAGASQWWLGGYPLRFLQYRRRGTDSRHHGRRRPWRAGRDLGRGSWRCHARPVDAGDGPWPAGAPGQPGDGADADACAGRRGFATTGPADGVDHPRMLLNTAVGTLYSFTARLLPAGTRRFRYGSVAAALLAFVCSLLGFVSLVGKVYPFFGYLGFLLIAAVLLGGLRLGRLVAPPRPA